MVPFTTLFARCWSRLAGFPGRRRQASPRRKKAVRPAVGALEDRLVPTVLFRPLFGTQASTHPQARVTYSVSGITASSSLLSPNIYPMPIPRP